MHADTHKQTRPDPACMLAHSGLQGNQFLEAALVFLLLSSIGERDCRKAREKMLCFTSKVAPPFADEVSSPFFSLWSCLPTRNKERRRAGWLQGAPDVAPRGPPDVGCLKAQKRPPLVCVGRSRGGACRDPCLCLDFKGSWALLELIGAFHNRDVPNPSSAAVLHIRTLPVGAEVSCIQSERCPSEGRAQELAWY